MAKEMRAAYCETLIELAKKDKRVVVLEADLMKASGTVPFKKEFPDRGLDVGVAEANMVGMAAGLSLNGYIPFAATFGTFASRRAFDQFFISSAYAKLNVKLVGTDPGVSAAFNGGTHMPFEDTGMMRLVPNLLITEPSDAVSAAAFTVLLKDYEGSAYMRLHRKAVDDIYKEGEKFELGKGKVLREGKDACIFALGAVLVHEALIVSDNLKKEGINVKVVDLLTLKPIDKKLVLDSVKECKVVLTAENNQVSGGLYSAVLELLNEEGVAKHIESIGVHDEFGQVGKVDYLQKAYGMDHPYIEKKIKVLLNK